MEKKVNKFFSHFASIQIIGSFINCRTFLNYLSEPLKKPQIIFIDMNMTCGDALLATTIIKTINKNCKVFGITNSDNETQIAVFLEEEGSGVINLEAIEKYCSRYNTSHEKILQVNEIIENLNALSNVYIDINFNIKTKNLNTEYSTSKIAAKFYKQYNWQQILLLQLNVLGTVQEKMAPLVSLSVPTIKRNFKKFLIDFETENTRDLANICISKGLAKLVNINYSANNYNHLKNDTKSISN